MNKISSWPKNHMMKRWSEEERWQILTEIDQKISWKSLQFVWFKHLQDDLSIHLHVENGFREILASPWQQIQLMFNTNVSQFRENVHSADDDWQVWHATLQKQVNFSKREQTWSVKETKRKTRKVDDRTTSMLAMCLQLSDK